MAEKLVNNTGLSEFATKIKESVPLVGTTAYTSGNISLDSMGSYSLNEIETPFTWIDGKKIYKKTVEYTDGFSEGTEYVTIPHNISNLDKIVKTEVLGIHRSPNYSTFPHSTFVEYWFVSLVDSSNIRIYKDSNFKANLPFYITLYYTKS